MKKSRMDSQRALIANALVESLMDDPTLAAKPVMVERLADALVLRQVRLVTPELLANAMHERYSGHWLEFKKESPEHWLGMATTILAALDAAG